MGLSFSTHRSWGCFAGLWILAFAHLCFPATTLAQSAITQLRELEISELPPSGAIPVFTNFPDHAAIIITSSIPTLQFDSNLAIVNQLSEPGEGRYILIIPPARQSIRVTAPGYIARSFPVGTLEARQVRYFRIEPKNVSITETGTLVVRTEPAGATLRLDGVPGTFTTPHTFTELLAQTYTARISLSGYRDEEIQVSVRADRPMVQTIDLTPTFGFVTIRVPQATLFLRDATSELEYRRTYTPGEPLRVDVGRYDYRIVRPFFDDIIGSFEITPNARIELNPNWDANTGFLNIIAPDAVVFVRSSSGGPELRLENPPSGGHPLPLGAYRYRVERDFYLPAEGTFEIIPNRSTTLRPDMRPAFGTLRVTVNNTEVILTSPDNVAPTSTVRGQIYLEPGLRTVTVAAPGHVAQDIELRVQPGEIIERNLTLETFAQRDERLRQQALPPGVLQISADVDAEILINGVRRGTQDVALTLAPGSYRVELRHPTRNSSFRVDVPSADLVERFVELRPVRARAITYGTLVPGAGHMYRKNWRGYLYFGLFAGSAAFLYLSQDKYNTDMIRYEQSQADYNAAATFAQARELRTILLQDFDTMNASRDMMYIAAGAVAGVYTLQWLDVVVTRPRYGYRGRPNPRSLAQSGQPPLRLETAWTGSGLKITAHF
jgi:hypothetical protein